MPYELYQELAANVKHAADSGYGPQAWFRELSKFLVIAEAPNTGTVEGETRIVVDDHTFTAPEGFIKFSGHQDGGMMKGDTPGEPGFMAQNSYTYEFFMVGDHAPLREKVEGLRNKAGIFLFKDPNCQDTRILQLGCECDPALFAATPFESGERKKGGKKGYKITVVSTCLFDYEGVITEKS